jgi:membrane-bound ClpP family serine protease
MAADISIGIVLVAGGIVLFAFELIHPGALLFIPGSVILVAGFFYLFFPTVLDTAIGPIAILVAAVIATVVELFYYRWVAPTHRPLSTTTSGLIGEEAVVIAPIVPDTLKGKVRLRSEVWTARASIPIPVGARVRVVGGEGVSVSVEPIQPPPAG